MPVGAHKVKLANVQAQEAAALGAAADERTAESAKRVREAEDQAKDTKEECAQLAKDNINLTRLLDASKVQVVQANRKASFAFNHFSFFRSTRQRIEYGSFSVVNSCMPQFVDEKARKAQVPRRPTGEFVLSPHSLI